MNKDEIIVKVQETAKERGVELSKKDTAIVVDSILDELVEGVKETGKVQLVGYLGLSIVDVAEREVPVKVGHPELGKKVSPAHKKVKVKLGKKFDL